MRHTLILPLISRLMLAMLMPIRHRARRPDFFCRARYDIADAAADAIMLMPPRCCGDNGALPMTHC